MIRRCFFLFSFSMRFTLTRLFKNSIKSRAAHIRQRHQTSRTFLGTSKATETREQHLMHIIYIYIIQRFILGSAWHPRAASHRCGHGAGHIRNTVCNKERIQIFFLQMTFVYCILQYWFPLLRVAATDGAEGHSFWGPNIEMHEKDEVAWSLGKAVAADD